MLAMVGHLGYIGDVQINGRSRPALGNDLYGSFGRDFATADGRRVMIIALTPRQWRALGRATGLADELAADRPAARRRSRHRSRPVSMRATRSPPLSAPWCAAKTLAEIEQIFAGSGVLWGPFQDFATLVDHDPRCSTANPLFAEVEQPGIGRYLMPGLPLDFSAAPRQPTRPAPRLGEHTDAVLSEVLGLSAAEIGRLHDAGIAPDPTRM